MTPAPMRKSGAQIFLPNLGAWLESLPFFPFLGSHNRGHLLSLAERARLLGHDGGQPASQVGRSNLRS